MSKGVTTSCSLRELCNCMSFVSQYEPKSKDDVILDEHWLIAINEELNEFTRNQVWELVQRPNNMQIIVIKWVFRNKLDENGIIVRNNARLVAKGYNQEE